MKRTCVALACLLVVGCGGSGSRTSPTAPDTSRELQGRTVSAIDGSAMTEVNIQLGDGASVQPDGAGSFRVPVSGGGPYAAYISGTPVVQRHTMLTPSGAARVSLIPASFDLRAFDEMFRAAHNRLQRWTTPPALVIVANVMKYVPTTDERFEARSEEMTDGEIAALQAHLTEGLALLTAGAFTSFLSVEIEHASAGQAVLVQRSGKIVVGRYVGIADGTSQPIIGYGNWAERSDGTVVAGTIWLDRDFDKNESGRRLLRIHELGHALGYNHVSLRTSIMNPAIGPEPTDFDRAGAAIAFQRPVGNVAPDTDPTPGFSSGTSQVAEGGVRWSPRIH